MDLTGFTKKAQQKTAENKELIKKIRQNRKINLDALFYAAHESVFNQINCLECANCCKSLGPRITNKDIERLSKYLGIKPSIFTEKYLLIDEDNDYVFKTMPCPFLMPDNFCSVYEQRPKACREYPHTNQRKMSQLLNICFKNSTICPAVFEIFEIIKAEIKAKP